jgi:hypothetical protein
LFSDAFPSLYKIRRSHISSPQQQPKEKKKEKKKPDLFFVVLVAINLFCSLLWYHHLLPLAVISSKFLLPCSDWLACRCEYSLEKLDATKKSPTRK